MRVALFEDEFAVNLAPLASLRPVFELLCGAWSARERVLRTLSIDTWGVFCRPDLVETYRESEPLAHINELGWLREGPTLFLNGRWAADPAELAAIRPNSVGLIDGEVAYLTIDPLEAPLLAADNVASELARLARLRTRVKAGGKLLARPWDVVNHNPQQISDDFALRSRGAKTAEQFSGLTILGEPRQIVIGPQVELDPFVVLDARKGPIILEAGAYVQAFTRVEGPCVVGRQSQLFRANVRAGTTIGPVCRVGGEIEQSILHGFVNKYHDGFLGHAYVCPWVNLGAITTNSDLKNDYSAVRVPTASGNVDTGSTKVGCFIGDHSKTAIGSFLNTGTSIGVMCLLLPGGELLPKYVPSFSRVWHGELDDGLAIDAGLATARAAMQRRGLDLTTAQERLIRKLHQQSRDERQAVQQRVRPTVALT